MIEQTERRAESIGKTSAASSRGFEKLNETLAKAQERLNVTANAFNKGEASSNQMRSALLGVEKAADSLSSKIKDTDAKLSDYSAKASEAAAKTRSFGDVFKGSFLGNLASNAVSSFTSQLTQIPAHLESIATKIYGLAQGWADAGSQIHDAGQKIALSAESLSAVKMAADISGSSLESFSGGFIKFEKTLATGGGKVKKTFEQMGIDIAAGAKNPEAAFSQFLTKFNTLPNDATRAAVATQLFGKSGAELIPTFLELGGSLDAAKQKAASLGLVFSQEAADNADKLGDTFDILKKQVAGLGFQFVGAFAPQLSDALGRVSGFIAANKSVFADWGAKLGAAIIYASEAVSNLANYFSTLSPATQAVIGTIGALIPVIAGVGVAFVAVASAVPLITGAIAAAGGLSVIAAVMVGVGASIAAVIGYGALLYEAWQTNFGGIKTFTLEVWQAVKSATSTAVNAIYDLTQSVGGQIINWWKDNYPLIEQTVKTVSDAIRAVVGSTLAAISDFWKSHGEQITAIVKTTWTFVSGYVKSSVELIGGVIKFAMQAINGDWSGAWETVGKTVGRSLSFTTETIKNALEGIKNLVVSAGTWLENNWQAIMIGIGTIVVKGIAAIAAAFFNLPVTIVSLVPKFIAAGATLWQAIYKGFREGMTQIDAGASATLGGKFAENLGGQNGLAYAKTIAAANEASAKAIAAAAQKSDAAAATSAKGLDLVGESAAKTKKHIDALTEATKTWNAASLASFARAQGFNPGSGFVTSGHNPNSLHYQNRALDVRLGGKSTEDVVNFMTKALEAGIRVVDERIKPKSGVVWTGPHVHTEENDKRASSFNPKLDYGGKLELLKALDAERVAGKSKTVADALKGIESQVDKTGEKAKQFAETFNGKLTDSINAISPKMNLSAEAAKNLGEKSKSASDAIVEQANRVAQLFGDLSQATPEMVKQANAIAAQTIAYEKNNAILDHLRETMDNFGQYVPEMDKLNALFADPKVIAALQQRADILGETLETVKGLMRATARAADNEKNNVFGNLGSGNDRGEADPDATGIGDGTNPKVTAASFPPPPIAPWDTFFGRLKRHFTQLESDTRTTSQVLADTLGQSLDRIQGIFSTAFGNLDGGFKGFFSSIAKGFADLVKEVIAQVLALLAVATIAGIITAIGGAGFGTGFKMVIKQGQGSGSIGGGILGGIFGGGGGGGSGSSGGDDGGYAFGGFTGVGGKYEPAGTVHKGEYVFPQETVKKYGVGFFERIKNGFQMPQLGYANGGFVGGSVPSITPSMMMSGNSYSNSSSTTNNNSPISIVVNAPGGNPQAVKMAAAQGTNEALRRLQAQERRNK